MMPLLHRRGYDSPRHSPRTRRRRHQRAMIRPASNTLASSRQTHNGSQSGDPLPALRRRGGAVPLRRLPARGSARRRPRGARECRAVTSAGESRRTRATDAQLPPLSSFAPPRHRDGGATAAVAGPVSPPAIIISFAAAATADRRHRFTPQDRTALIALGYALAGWTVAFESDGQDMQWAALCPPDRDSADARYLVGRDGSARRSWGRLGAGPGTLCDRCGAGPKRQAPGSRVRVSSGSATDADLDAQSHRPARHRFP